MASAAAHSRSPVTAAGGICPNSRSASPAPNCTDTMPVRIMAAGSAIRDWAIRDWARKAWAEWLVSVAAAFSPT